MADRGRGDILTTILAILMLLEITALAAGAGYLVLTGKVTDEQVRLVWKTFQGEVREDDLKDAEAWRKHEAEQKRAEEMKTSGASADTKLTATELEARAMLVGLEAEKKAVEDRLQLERLRLEEIEQRKQELQNIEKRIDEKLVAIEAGSGKASFQDMVGIVKAMKAPEIKDYLVAQDPETVSRILTAIGSRLAAKVLKEFRTPQEKELVRLYLDTIRSGDPGTGTGAETANAG